MIELLLTGLPLAGSEYSILSSLISFSFIFRISNQLCLYFSCISIHLRQARITEYQPCGKPDVSGHCKGTRVNRRLNYNLRKVTAAITGRLTGLRPHCRLYCDGNTYHYADLLNNAGLCIWTDNLSIMQFWAKLLKNTSTEVHGIPAQQKPWTLSHFFDSLPTMTMKRKNRFKIRNAPLLTLPP